MYESLFEDDINALAAAHSSGLLIGLNSLAGGRDIFIDGTPAEHFVNHFFLKLVADDSSAGIQSVLNTFSHNEEAIRTALRADAWTLLRASRDEFDFTTQTTTEQIYEKFQNLAALSVHGYWDMVRLPHEGGNPRWEELQVFAMVCQRYAVNNLSGSGEDHDYWSNQVRMRLSKQLVHGHWKPESLIASSVR